MKTETWILFTTADDLFSVVIIVEFQSLICFLVFYFIYATSDGKFSLHCSYNKNQKDA